MLSGDDGRAVAMAMRLVVALAEALGSSRLIEVSRAHVDGCLYHGKAGLEFAEMLVAAGAGIRVPTTLNVASLDLLHPDLYRGSPDEAVAAKRLMEAYVAMGCRPTWTCAPYQLTDRPTFGEQIAWAESNAIVFANSVLGARTDRYGDFIDICAAITGRVPAHGLHLDENRRAGLVISVEGVASSTRRSDVFFPVLGHLTGQLAGNSVAAVTGVHEASEDQLKALGAAAASSGAVALFHVVGCTPEAPTLESVLAPDGNVAFYEVGSAELRTARAELTTWTDAKIGAVSLGTPHASGAELHRIAGLLGGRSVAPGIDCYVSTGRDVAASSEAVIGVLERAGVRLVTDTCTYISPVLDSSVELVMTDSAKWAFYAPANLGVQVAFGSTRECVESAVAGSVIRDDGIWDE